MTLSINNEQETYPVDEVFLTRAVEAALALHGGVTDAQLGITLVDDEAIRQLNREFRRIDRATDVLSFPLIEFGGDYEEGDDPWEDDASLFLDKDPATGEVMLGDLVISLPTCYRQAEIYGHSPQRELAYLTVHGMLHLLGYDHETEGDKVLMRRLEEEILTSLGLPRTALVTEGAILELTAAADQVAAPQGAALLGSDGAIYQAPGGTGEAALAAARAKLPANVTPLACAATEAPSQALPCPLYCPEAGSWVLQEQTSH